MSDINKKFEAKHQANIKANQEKLRKAYLKVINKIYKKASGLRIKGNSFRISDYPVLSEEVDKALLTFKTEADLTLLNAVKSEWELSIEKNGEIIHKAYGAKNISEAVNKIVFDPQGDALEKFTSRKTKGLTLSDRVLKYTGQFRSQIEQNLFAGLSEGKSAIAMARDQVAYMDNPEPLFRRVKYITKNGNVVYRPSKAAKEYYDKLGAPGQGVYRSPYKNFMRITRNTINDSYRESDMVRYQTIPFILSYNVNLSNGHPRRDICDDLKGTYPKTFVWRKWHIQCLCNCTSNLASPAEFEKYQEAVSNGEGDNFKFSGAPTDLPKNFNKYLSDNKGFMDNWKVKPDWVTENGIRI